MTNQCEQQTSQSHQKILDGLWHRSSDHRAEYRPAPQLPRAPHTAGTVNSAEE